MISKERENFAALFAVTMKRQETLPLEMTEARAVTDGLWELLRPAAMRERPVPERHRLIFYLGHLEAFDWNLIGRRGLGERSFHPAFDQLFEFGIDPPMGELPQDGPGDWPAEAEIQAYNQRTRETIDRLVTHAPPEMVEAAIEHRLMHAETLAYLIHNLPYTDKLRVKARGFVSGGRARLAGPLEVPAGVATLGKSVDEAFGWDNEFGQHRVAVSAFRCAREKVTHGEYLQYVEDGGAVPHFWRQEAGRWCYRGMFELQPMPMDAPVYVTQRQAMDYAKWRGQTLLTEAQFHRLADDLPQLPGNYDFATWDPVAVSSTGPLIGNGWEWTRTPFAPFAGFAPLPFYPTYSADFFDGEHYVLKGASPRTAKRFLRPSFRNWFRADYPYAYASFRVVEK